MTDKKLIITNKGTVGAGHRFIEGTLDGVPIAITENGKGSYAVSKQDVDQGKPYVVEQKDLDLPQLP